MTKCPFCAEMIQDEAVKCRFCGEFLNKDPDSGRPEEVLAPVMPPEKLAEIRRLQRIAGGVQTRADTMRKTKGILYLVIIIAILAYSWQWRRLHEAEKAAAPDRTEITFEAFSGLFGPNTSLSQEARDREFKNFRGKRVLWEGEVVYTNRSDEAVPYLSVRHRTTTRTADVIVYFTEETRGQVMDLKVGSQVRYVGKIVDFGEESGFITLKEGAIKG